jgi:hypothetical protein
VVSIIHGVEMTARDILILANSRRHNGHCIAGKDISTGEWIRPINVIEPGLVRLDPSAFLEQDFQIFIGNPYGPQLLDCIRIGFGERCPLYYQHENIAIDRTPWTQITPLEFQRIPALIDRADSCCLQDNDPYLAYIPAEALRENPRRPSLSFIRLTKESNNVEVIHTTTQRGKPQHRLIFDYGTKRYDFPITDYRYENFGEISPENDAIIFKDFYATIGLGEKFSPYNTNLELHYRFIVGIIPSYLVRQTP